jgi:hypothetical protein
MTCVYTNLKDGEKMFSDYRKLPTRAERKLFQPWLRLTEREDKHSPGTGRTCLNKIPGAPKTRVLSDVISHEAKMA